jgi:molybdopterin-guanine dinucleotide biosynthesis protein A
MIDLLLRVGASPVVTVGGPDRGFDVPHLHDLYPGQGPLGGLVTGLASVATEWAVVVACDQPFLTSETVRILIEGAHADVDVLAALTDRVEPLCACYRVEVCHDRGIEAFAAGIRSMTEFLGLLRVRTIPVERPSELQNVNRPEDHVI